MKIFYTILLFCLFTNVFADNNFPGIQVTIDATARNPQNGQIVNVRNNTVCAPAILSGIEYTFTVTAKSYLGPTLDCGYVVWGIHHNGQLLPNTTHYGKTFKWTFSNNIPSEGLEVKVSVDQCGDRFGNKGNTSYILFTPIPKPLRPAIPPVVCKGGTVVVETPARPQDAVENCNFWGTYDWILPTGWSMTNGSDPSKKNVTVPPIISEGYYYVKVRHNWGGGLVSGYQNLPVWVGRPNVNPSPSGLPAIQASLGSVVTIHTTVDGAAPFSPQWSSSNSSALSLSSSAGASVSVECLRTGYNYIYVKATNFCGTGNVRQIPINVSSGGGGMAGASANNNNTLPETKDSFKENTQSATVYPNPIKDYFSVQFHQNISGKVQVQLVNISNGQSTILSEKNLEKGIHLMNFNSTKIESGVYLLRIVSSDQIISRKIVKN